MLGNFIITLLWGGRGLICFFRIIWNLKDAYTEVIQIIKNDEI